MTVAVFASERALIRVRREDIRLEWFSGTGKGGQHRNKHQNSCRAIHEPTGITAKAECRSRQASEAQALAEIERRVLGELGDQNASTEAAKRRMQVGSGMRGDKVRTYRLQDDIVTDHRSGRQARWTDIERGRFDLLG